MVQKSYYSHQIRNADNSLYGIASYKFSLRNNWWEIAHVEVTSPGGVLLAHNVYLSRDHYFGEKLRGENVPDWLVAPSHAALTRLCGLAFPEPYEIVAAATNAVTIAAYRENGALLGHFRSLLNPQFLPLDYPASPSLYGGEIEPEDFGMEGEDTGDTDPYLVTSQTAVLREAWEELNVDLEAQQFRFIGNLFDADYGRFNHVYRLITPYEQALKETHNSDIDALLKAVLDSEGLGRFSIFREDLERAMETDVLTPISTAILKAYPELLPPSAPKAA